MKTILYDDFSNESLTKELWDWKKPWGNTSHNSIFTEWENVEFIDDGLRFFHTPIEGELNKTNSGLIYFKNMITGVKRDEQLPFQYGRFSAEITAPIGTHCAFWLLSQVRTRQGIRSILPEVDIAEFGVPNDQYRLNQAVHYWNPNVNIKWNDGDDYRFKKQRSKQMYWPSGRNTYSVEIGKLFTTFYINDKKSFRIISKDSGSYFTPLFTHTNATWQNPETLKDVILHSVEIEQ